MKMQKVSKILTEGRGRPDRISLLLHALFLFQIATLSVTPAGALASSLTSTDAGLFRSGTNEGKPWEVDPSTILITNQLRVLGRIGQELELLDPEIKAVPELPIGVESKLRRLFRGFPMDRRLNFADLHRATTQVLTPRNWAPRTQKEIRALAVNLQRAIDSGRWGDMFHLLRRIQRWHNLGRNGTAAAANRPVTRVRVIRVLPPLILLPNQYARQGEFPVEGQPALPQPSVLPQGIISQGIGPAGRVPQIALPDISTEPRIRASIIAQPTVRGSEPAIFSRASQVPPLRKSRLENGYSFPYFADVGNTPIACTLTFIRKAETPAPSGAAAYKSTASSSNALTPNGDALAKACQFTAATAKHCLEQFVSRVRIPSLGITVQDPKVLRDNPPSDMAMIGFPLPGSCPDDSVVPVLNVAPPSPAGSAVQPASAEGRTFLGGLLRRANSLFSHFFSRSPLSQGDSGGPLITEGRNPETGKSEPQLSGVISSHFVANPLVTNIASNTPFFYNSDPTQWPLDYVPYRALNSVRPSSLVATHTYGQVF